MLSPVTLWGNQYPLKRGTVAVTTAGLATAVTVEGMPVVAAALQGG